LAFSAIENAGDHVSVTFNARVVAAPPMLRTTLGPTPAFGPSSSASPATAPPPPPPR
jgi:hypothetical protein